MSWLADVIYGLKQENGKPKTFFHEVKSFNPATGANTATTTSFTIQLVIALTLDIRQAFFKAINLQKEAYLKPGEQQFIIDYTDIPAGKSIVLNDYLTDAYSTRFDITNVDDLEREILIITCKAVGF